MVNTKIRLIIFFEAEDGEALYSQQKQDRELSVTQILNCLLPNSDFNWNPSLTFAKFISWLDHFSVAL